MSFLILHNIADTWLNLKRNNSNDHDPLASSDVITWHT